MPVTYEINNVEKKEDFAQSVAQQVLGVDLGAGVCQVCSMWWLEHMKGGGKADDHKFVFKADAAVLKDMLIDSGQGSNWLSIMDARLTQLGFTPAGHMKNCQDNLDGISQALAAASPNYHLIFLGPLNGTNHVLAMHNDNTAGTKKLHLFEPNSGHFRTDSKDAAKAWLEKAKSFYAEHGMGNWTLASYVKT